MAFGDSDLSVFFGDFGAPVVFAGVTALGNFDATAAGINFGGGPSSIERQTYSVTLPATAFSRLLKNGDALTVSGAAYRVKGREISLDGSIATYTLESA